MISWMSRWGIWFSCRIWDERCDWNAGYVVVNEVSGEVEEVVFQANRKRWELVEE